MSGLMIVAGIAGVYAMQTVSVWFKVRRGESRREEKPGSLLEQGRKANDETE